MDYNKNKEELAAWLSEMHARARKCRQEELGPQIGTGCYAFGKVRGTWRISNGNSWLNEPKIVEEIHEYRDGDVCANYYVDGIKMFGRKAVEASGMKAVRPEELPGFFQATKIVYYDHRAGKRITYYTNAT